MDGMSGVPVHSGSRQARELLFVVILVALIIRLVFFFGGVRGSDAYAYAHHAYNIATGQYDVMAETHYYGFRYAVLLPTALAYALFGVSDWSSALFPLLASLGTLLLVVRLGMEWFDRQMGLLAGLLYTFYPLDLISATLLGPSSFLPFLSAGAILAFSKAGETTGWRRASLCVVTGLCIGLATQAREVGLLLLAPVGLMALSWQGWERRSATIGWLSLGVALPLLLEGLYYWHATGDPFYRITVISRLSEPLAGGPDPEGEVSLMYYPRALLGLDLGGLANFGFFGYLGLWGIILAARRNEWSSLRVLLFWIIPVFAYLEFGSMSLTRYLPIIKSYNYCSLISVPLVLLGAYSLLAIIKEKPKAEVNLRSAGWRVALVAAGVVGLAATSLYGVYRVRENIWDDSHPYQVVAAAAAVQAHPERPIYVPHFRWALFLNYHLRYQTGFNFYNRQGDVGSGRIHYLHEVQDATELPPAYVVIHDRYLYYDTKGRPVGKVQNLPAYVFSPPASWRVVVTEPADPVYNSFVLYETD